MDAPIFSASTASTSSTSVPNVKKRRINVEVESDYECSYSEVSLKVPCDDSSDASSELFLGDDDDDAQ